VNDVNAFTPIMSYSYPFLIQCSTTPHYVCLPSKDSSYRVWVGGLSPQRHLRQLLYR
jgi:hypothetical protein